MIDISLSKVTINYGFGNILENVSLDIMRGETISLIGDNGVGKTTILKLIMGLEKPTFGTISIRKNATIGYLDQMMINENKHIKVCDILYESIGNIVIMEQSLRKYEEKMQQEKGNELDKLITKYTSLQEQFMTLGGYEISEKIGKIVKEFNIGYLLDLYYDTLSCGEKRIVSLASIMLKTPDILLLDEPTNHLGIETLELLEKYLKNYKVTIVLVSHDRYFLDKISDKTILLENSKLNIYFGNYSYFLEESGKRLMLEFKNYNNQQKQINAMKESIRETA